MIDILEFLRVGQWNDLTVGMQLSDFEKLVPNFSDKLLSYFDESNPSYGFTVNLDELEIMVEQDILYSIKFNTHHGLLIGNQFEVNNHSSLDEILTILKINKIPWVFDNVSTLDNQLALILESKVIILFLFDARLGLKLNKFQVFFDYYDEKSN